MLPELELNLDIPELDIDLSGLPEIDLELPELAEGVADALADDFYFDLTGIDADIADFVAGVDELDLNFPEDELNVLIEAGETHEL